MLIMERMTWKEWEKWCFGTTRQWTDVQTVPSGLCVHVCERLCVCTGGLECLKQTLCVLEIRDTQRAQNSTAHHEPTEQNYCTRFTAERKSRKLEEQDKPTEKNSRYSEFLRHMQRGNELRIVKYNKRTEERNNKRMIEEGRGGTDLIPGRLKESNQRIHDVFFSTMLLFIWTFSASERMSPASPDWLCRIVTTQQRGHFRKTAGKTEVSAGLSLFIIKV